MITLDSSALADFCKKRHIQKLSLFGSAVRADFRPMSDLDLLIEFEPDHTPGLAFFSLADELSAFFGRKVDLNTPRSLSRYFREQVLSESEILYDSTRS
jgi:predicted nucleotidyltransferase